TSFLLPDDINGIRALYGAGTGSVQPLAGPPPAPTGGSTATVSVSGTTLMVVGTFGNDTMTFTAGATNLTLTINGTTYNINPANIHAVSFDGGNGQDTVTVNTRAGLVDTAQFRPGMATVGGANYRLDVSGTETIIVNGGREDSALMADSAGNDWLVS